MREQYEENPKGGNSNHSFPDQEFIAAVKSGGASLEKMTGKLISHYGGYQWKLRQKFWMTKEMVIDAFTDAVMELIRMIRVGTFDTTYTISTCLYRITYNRCIDQLRKAGRAKSRKELPVPETMDIPGERSVFYEILRTEAFEGVLSAINSLREKCREILLKWGYWGYSMEEIAEMVGSKNAQTVRQEKSRCLKTLQQTIRETHDYPYPTAL